jgi:hypothetical protein
MPKSRLQCQLAISFPSLEQNTNPYRSSGVWFSLRKCAKMLRRLSRSLGPSPSSLLHHHLFFSSITTKLPLTILKSFPPHHYPVPWASLLPLIQNHPSQPSNPSRLVVLDDDPTGCQTMYDINVLLRYDVDTLTTQLRLNHPVFYILTKTRAMSETHALDTTKTVIQNLFEAKKRIQYPFSFEFISRGDSTLRGHFPAEVEAIAESADLKNAAIILLPAFFEGGRVTINSTHYLTEKNELIPVGMTPFATDPHFGFRSRALSPSTCPSSPSFLFHKVLQSSGLDSREEQWENRSAEDPYRHPHRSERGRARFGLQQIEEFVSR